MFPPINRHDLVFDFQFKIFEREKKKKKGRKKAFIHRKVSEKTWEKNTRAECQGLIKQRCSCKRGKKEKAG